MQNIFCLSLRYFFLLFFYSDFLVITILDFHHSAQKGKILHYMRRQLATTRQCQTCRQGAYVLLLRLGTLRIFHTLYKWGVRESQSYGAPSFGKSLFSKDTLLNRKLLCVLMKYWTPIQNRGEGWCYIKLCIWQLSYFYMGWYLFAAPSGMNIVNWIIMGTPTLWLTWAL